MFLKVDFSLDLFRWLFNPLYKRILDEALAEGNNENQVRARMMSILGEDTRVICLIDLIDSEIKSHGIFVIVDNVCIIEQLSEDTGFAAKCFDYIRDNTKCDQFRTVVSPEKQVKFQNSYEFSLEKVALTRAIKRDSVE